jgi:hypothetical protein
MGRLRPKFLKKEKEREMPRTEFYHKDRRAEFKKETAKVAKKVRMKRLVELRNRYSDGDPFFRTREWLQMRYMVLKDQGHQCALCRVEKNHIPMHVDHIKPRSKYPELALTLSNLQVLCEPCNLGKGNWDETDWRKPEIKPVSRFDKGDPITL